MTKAVVLDVAATVAVPTRAFQLEIAPDGLAAVTFDLPGEKVNKYSASVVKELDLLLDRLAASKEIKALVLFSGKPDIFIAGADVKEFSDATEAAVRASVERGQAVFGKLANLPFPTVAAIHGACLGGGCETVLAMDWRLASDSKKTQVGLPEVKLGIIPAWGGTTRLPRTIGLAGALDIILNGKALDGKRARKAGLVDEVVPEPLMRDYAMSYARGKFGTAKRANAGDGGGPLRARPATLQEKLLEGLGKGIVFKKARQAVMKQTKGHYPAPLEAIGAIEKGLGAPLAVALSLEVEAVLRLVKTPVVRHLVGLFFQMEEVKKESGTPAGSPPVKGRKVSRVGVLGAGVMGGGIAQLAADKGYPVRMKDIKAEMLAGGYAAAAKIWREKLKKRRMTKAEFAGKMSLLSGSLDWAGFGTCDVTVEAVLEKLAVKQAVLKEWEAVSPDSAIFASNTSTLPITDIAAAARIPERVVGMHFFNPVHKMPLVEVIWGAKTAPEVTATIFDLARRMGKTPVVVKDAPGFLVNRILAPYLGEAVRLLMEGNSMESIDRAMRSFGMPVGPIELLDDVGIDVATKGAEILSAAWPTRMPIDPSFGKMITTGRCGRKTKKGFYAYEGEKRTGPDPTVYAELNLPAQPKGTATPQQIEDRLILPMVNEAAWCLAEGIVESPAKLDLAMIFGTGFPPFRGGLCRYADARGVSAVVATLDVLSAEKGPRFEPAPFLVELAKANKSLYGKE